MVTRKITIECANRFSGDDRVEVKGPKEINGSDLIFSPGDPQMLEVVKARVAVSLKRGRATKIIIDNKTKGPCKITVEKFAEFKRGRP